MIQTAYDMNSSYVGTTLGGEAIDTMLSWDVAVARWLAAAGKQGNPVRDGREGYSCGWHRLRSSQFKLCVRTGNDGARLIDQKSCDVSAVAGAVLRCHAALLATAVVRQFPNRDMKDWANRYYGENLARLSRVKQKYDPKNVFRFAERAFGNGRPDHHIRSQRFLCAA